MGSNLSYKQLSYFFIPLGISASLMSVTHIIINGTLSRADDAAFIISAYAIAMALFGIIERPMLVFRQASSALVFDRHSFKLIKNFLIYVMSFILLLCIIIGFTPVGKWIYIHLFNATTNMVGEVNNAFRVLILVLIFSGIRSIYQGIIINQFETNWITVGVVIRLIAMFLMAYGFIYFDYMTSATGAMIFLVGMFIEASISVYRGSTILKKKLPDVRKGSRKLLKADVSRFYFPLMYYFFLQSLLVPIIYMLLAKSEDIEMSIASFALALSITMLILSFFMYTHQLVLQFYKDHRRKIIIFLIFISLIPTILLCILCYTPVGPFFMMEIMGAEEALSIATIAVLKFFIVKTLIYPWVDFLSGFLMLMRETNKMLYAQIGNLVVAAISLSILIRVTPQLNGVNGSLASSLGEIAGFIIISLIVYLTTDKGQTMKRKLVRKLSRT